MRRLVGLMVATVIGMAGLAGAQIAPQTFDLGNLQKHAIFIQTATGTYRPLLSTDVATDTNIAAVEAAVLKIITDLSSSETGVCINNLTGSLASHATKMLGDLASSESGVYVKSLDTGLAAVATKIVADQTSGDTGVAVNNLTSALAVHSAKVIADQADPDTGVALAEQTATDTVIWLTCTTASTEYSVTLPAKTIRWEVRGLTNTVPFNIAFASGESGTNYWPLFAGETQYDWSDAGYNGASKTLYVQSNTDGAVLVIHCKLKP